MSGPDATARRWVAEDKELVRCEREEWDYALKRVAACGGVFACASLLWFLAPVAGETLWGPLMIGAVGGAVASAVLSRVQVWRMRRGLAQRREQERGGRQGK